MQRRLGWIGAYGAFLLTPVALALAAPAKPESPPQPAGANEAQLQLFESKVRPLLLDRCGKCHGEKLQQGGLRLDTAEGFRKGSDQGPLTQATNPEQSLLLRAVRHEGGLAMPPGEKLSDGEIATLTAWVKAGAPWSEKVATPAASGKPHWAFQPVSRPPVPAVKLRGWGKTPVDAFILARLEREGLRPSPVADRRTLIRRATFDLTGLPPTPDEIHAFLQDRSPNAWEKVVDRLLASPAYGERWGRHWLDVARYADSKDVRDIGQPFDIVESYRYRDWVIRAFNEDLPYNQFITNQIAGDLLPPTKPGEVNADGITATTFLTIGGWGPGDADLLKMHADMVDDQVNAVSRAFLGLTVGCARCHDHKFDPITTADYYGLAGIFFSTTIATPQISAPYVKVPLVSTDEIKRREQYLTRLPEMEKNLQRFNERAYAEVPKRFINQTAAYLTAVWDRRHPDVAPGAAPNAPELPAGLREGVLKQWLNYLEHAPPPTGLMTVLARDSGMPGVHAWRSGPADTPVAMVNTTDQTVTVPGTMPPHSVAIHPGPTTGIALSWRSPVAITIRVTGRIADAHAGCGDGAEWRIERVRSGAIESLASDQFDDGGATKLAETRDAPRLQSIPVAAGDEIRFGIIPRQNHGCDMTLMDLQVEEVGGAARVWSPSRDMATGPVPSDGGNPRADGFGNTGVWSFLDLAKVKDEVHADHTKEGALAAWLAATDRPGAVRAADQLVQALQDADVANRTDATGRLWRDLASAQGPYRVDPKQAEGILDPSVLAERFRLERELLEYRRNAPPPVPYAMGAKEGGAPGTKYEGFRDAAIHIRGRYDRLGEIVPRRFPVVLAGANQPRITEGSGRKELAQWIAGASNPLTARVIVNRVWQGHFGQGLVRTPGNFGKLGEPPTHPELLDWLASTFMQPVGEGGGLGWSLKRLHRLLMLSSVYMQQSAMRPELHNDPENRLWARANVRRLEAEPIRDTLLAVAGLLDRTMFGPPARKPGDDAMSRRRAVYLMTNRSDKSGLRFLFDAADPEAIVDQRTVSTVAPQALFLLNDPFLVEQTAALAGRLLEKPEQTTAQRIAQAYELLYGRPPTQAEIEVGTAFLDRHTGNPEALRQAWEQYCQVLLCANELIYLD